MSNYDKNISHNQSVLNNNLKSDVFSEKKVENEKDIEEDKDKIENERVDSVPFLKLFKYSSPKDRLLYTLGILCAIGNGLATPANLLIFGNLTNAFVTVGGVTAEKFLDEIRTFAIGNTIIGVAALLTSYGAITFFNYAAQNQVLRIRGNFFLAIMHQDMTWFDFNQSGEVASRMNEDLTKLEDGIGEKVAMFVQYVSAFVFSIVLALVKGWQLALVCLISLPVTMIALGLVAMFTSRIAKKELIVNASAGNTAEQAISSIRTVKSFEGEEKEVSFYKSLIVNARKLSIQRNFFSGLGFGILWFCIYASYGLAFWYGVGLVLKNNAGEPGYENYDAGNMITVFFCVMMGSMNIGISSPYIEAFGVAKGAAGKVFKTIDQQPTINPIVPRGITIRDPIRKIEFIGVDFNYPTRKTVQVLKNFNLKIERGQTVALVGASGSGKSTCIQLIQRFYDPLQGKILVNDLDMKEYEVKSLRDRIGVVGQEPILFGTSVYENIRFGREDATKEQIETAAKAANAHNFIIKLPEGYNTLVGERGSQMSGGQKQRISIARALIRDPDVLLLDEATSALDTASEKKVQRALEKASEGRTTVIVAHRLSTIRNAETIIVFNQGEVVETGNHASLMAKKGTYYNLVIAQVGEEPTNAVENKKALDNFDYEDDEDLPVFTDIAEELDEIEKKQSYLRQILRYNKPEWFQILVGCIASAIAGFAMPIFAVLFGDIIQVLSVDDPTYVRENTNQYSLYFVICGIVVGIASFIQIYAFGIAGEKLTERLRGLLFENIVRQEIGWFDDKANSTGTLCARLSGDAAAVQGATGQRIGSIVQSLSTLCLAVGLSLYYEWSLGLVALVFAPVILITTYLQQRVMSQENMGMAKALGDCTKLAVEAVSNIKTVISLCRENMFYLQYMEMLTPQVQRSKRNNHFRGVVFGLARSVMYFAYAVCIYYGGNLVIYNGVQIGVVFKVSQALIMGTVTIGNVLAFTPNLQKGLAAAGHIYKLITREVVVVERPDAIRNPITAKGEVSYNDVEFKYPTRKEIQVLQRLNLSVYEGQKIALVGPSGCGKSTCLQLLLRYYDVDAGSVKIDQYDVRELSFGNLYKQLGIVSQEPILFNRTIAENIAYGDNKRMVSEVDIIAAASKANIHQFISSLPLGYETMLGEKGTQLSGGQKQRIAIARVLIRNPKIILLDEATSALDTASEKIVQDSLDIASEGRTTISIAHRLSTIINSDRIFVLDRGVVAEQGTHRELLDQQGIYNTLYRLQNPGV